MSFVSVAILWAALTGSISAAAGPNRVLRYAAKTLATEVRSVPQSRLVRKDAQDGSVNVAVVDPSDHGASVLAEMSSQTAVDIDESFEGASQTSTDMGGSSKDVSTIMDFQEPSVAQGLPGDQGPVGPVGEAGAPGPAGGAAVGHLAKKWHVMELWLLNLLSVGLFYFFINKAITKKLVQERADAFKKRDGVEGDDAGAGFNISGTWTLTDAVNGTTLSFELEQAPAEMDAKPEDAGGDNVFTGRQLVEGGAPKEIADGTIKGTAVEWKVEGTTYKASAADDGGLVDCTSSGPDGKQALTWVCSKQGSGTDVAAPAAPTK